MNLREEEEQTIDNLLSAEIETAKSAIISLANNIGEKTVSALIILWQLHPQETVQIMAKKSLVNVLDAKLEKKIIAGFELFSSIGRDLPWNNTQALDIQLSNFEALKKILPNYEGLLAAHQLYSEMLLDLGRKLLLIFNLEEQASYIFEIIVKHSRNNDEALFALGRIEEKKGNIETALDYFEKAIVSNPENGFAQIQAGIIKYSFLKKYESALHHFSKASEQDPYSVEPYVRMAECAYKLDNIPAARQYLDIALSINEYQEEALNLWGTLQWKVDQKYEEAVETFKKGIDHKIHEDSALLLKSLGDIYAQHFQEFDKAKLFYEKSLRANPVQKSLLENYVPFILKHFQDLGAVEKSYNDFLTLKPNDADILTAYATFIIEYLNDYDTAYTYLERALEQNADHEAALKQMRKIAEYVEKEEIDSTEEDDDDDEEDDDVEIIVLDEEWFEEDDDDEEDDDFSGGGAAPGN